MRLVRKQDALPEGQIRTSHKLKLTSTRIFFQSQRCTGGAAVAVARDGFMPVSGALITFWHGCTKSEWGNGCTCDMLRRCGCRRARAYCCRGQLLEVSMTFVSAKFSIIDIHILVYKRNKQELTDVNIEFYGC